MIQKVLLEILMLVSHISHIRQEYNDGILLPDDLPVERAGHAGQVKSKILHDVRSLFFRGVVHADRHRSHGHLDLHLLLIVVRRL